MKELTNKLFVEKTDNIFLQFFRFIFVGGTAFLIDFFIYFALVEFLNVNYLISAAILFSPITIYPLHGYSIKAKLRIELLNLIYF